METITINQLIQEIKSMFMVTPPLTSNNAIALTAYEKNKGGQ